MGAVVTSTSITTSTTMNTIMNIIMSTEAIASCGQ